METNADAVEVLSEDRALLHGLPVPVLGLRAVSQPLATEWRAPRGRKSDVVDALLKVAPWLCMRDAPGEASVAQLLGVTPQGQPVVERIPQAWADADQQGLAHRLVLRIGKRVRRLALRGASPGQRVSLRDAATYLAEREVAAVRSWQCAMGRWACRQVEGSPGERDPAAVAMAWRQRTRAIADAFMAAAETPAAMKAVPFPKGWLSPQARRPTRHIGAAHAKRLDSAREAFEDALRVALRAG